MAAFLIKASAVVASLLLVLPTIVAQMDKTPMPAARTGATDAPAGAPMGGKNEQPGAMKMTEMPGSTMMTGMPGAGKETEMPVAMKMTETPKMTEMPAVMMPGAMKETEMPTAMKMMEPGAMKETEMPTSSSISMTEMPMAATTSSMTQEPVSNGTTTGLPVAKMTQEPTTAEPTATPIVTTKKPVGALIAPTASSDSVGVNMDFKAFTSLVAWLALFLVH